MATRSGLVVGAAGVALALGGLVAASDLGPDNTQAKHVAVARVTLADDPDSGGQANAVVLVGAASPNQAAPPTIRD